MTQFSRMVVAPNETLDVVGDVLVQWAEIEPVGESKVTQFELDIQYSDVMHRRYYKRYMVTVWEKNSLVAEQNHDVVGYNMMMLYQSSTSKSALRLTMENRARKAWRRVVSALPKRPATTNNPPAQDKTAGG
jgi:hypothetical protein